MRSHFRSAWLLLDVAAKTGKLRLAGAILLEMSGGAAGVCLALGLRAIADAVGARDERAALQAVAIIAGLQGALWLGQGFGTRLRLNVLERVGHAFDLRVTSRISALDGVAHLETPSFHDQIELIRGSQGSLGNGVNSLVNFLNFGVAQCGLAAAVLAEVHPALVVLPLIGIPVAVVEARAMARVESAEMTAIPDRRRARDLHAICTNAAAAKEVRAYGLEAVLPDRQRMAWTAAESFRFAARWRAARDRTAASVLFGVGFACAVVFVAIQAVRGDASAGEVVLTAVIGTQVVGYAQSALASFSSLRLALQETARVVWLDDYASSNEHPGQGTPPSRLRSGITLERVTFSYGESARPALRDISLSFPAGSLVAIIGENGAGKTTLIKLLCKLYSAGEGLIAVDETPLDDLDTSQWRGRITSVAQDFWRPEFRLQHAVGFGHLPLIDDHTATTRALNAIGAERLLELPDALATQLGVQWPAGRDISGGEWQKVALARGSIRPSPLLLILDEPTASLDVASEQAVYERYAELTEAARAEAGAVTIFVSHRLSAASIADQIVVLKDGAVVESGTPAELLDRPGLYRELVEIQARGYE